MTDDPEAALMRRAEQLPARLEAGSLWQRYGVVMCACGHVASVEHECHWQAGAEAATVIRDLLAALTRRREAQTVDQEGWEPSDGGRIVRVNRDGSWLEDSREGQRTLRRFAEGQTPASGWQPIATAPKDGTTVLVTDGKYVWTAGTNGTWGSLSGWQPLPSPPLTPPQDGER